MYVCIKAPNFDELKTSQFFKNHFKNSVIALIILELITSLELFLWTPAIFKTQKKNLYKCNKIHVVV